MYEVNFCIGSRVWLSAAFASAVDWSETWIRGVLAAELALFLLVLLTRKMFYTQCCIFLLICGLVFASETLNTHLGARWKEFARQNYFDEHGVFMATLYAGPLLCIAFVQLVSCALFGLSWCGDRMTGS